CMILVRVIIFVHLLWSVLDAFFFFQAEDGIRDRNVTGVQTCALPIFHGESLETFLQKYGTKWIGLFLIQLLQQLSALHEAGFIFGDLKLENMLVDKRDMRLRFVDVGGVTKVGRAIKEYTAFCDRASWQLGSRKAEASYDLFALVMTCLQIFHREQSI